MGGLRFAEMTFISRRGRTRNANDLDVQARHGLKAIIFMLVAACAMVYFPFWLYQTEILRRDTFAAFAEAEEIVIHLPGDGPPAIPKPDGRDQGKLLFFTSSDVRTHGPIKPSGFHFEVDALRVRWTPQYCQWTEIETCTEHCTGDGDDQSCDTQCEFNYHKTWEYHRVNSLLFDQPAAHYNPQRDPRPPHTDTAPSATAGAFTLTHPVIEHLNRFRPLSWSHGGVRKPEAEYGFFERNWRAFKMWTFDWQDQTRFEKLRDLGAHMQPAGRLPGDVGNPDDFFRYMGNGYFYSEYTGGTAGMLFNWLGQYLEGSLFDWQLGDVLGKAFDACEAGDIRGRFDVADAHQVSVLASVADSKGTLAAHRMSNGFELALMDEGSVSMKNLMDQEKSAIGKLIWLQRLLCVLWAYTFQFLVLQTALKVEITATAPVPTREIISFGLAGLLLGGKWWLVYGISDFTGHETSVATLVLLGVSASLLAIGAQRCNAERKTYHDKKE